VASLHELSCGVCMHVTRLIRMNSIYSVYIGVAVGTLIRTAMTVQIRMYGS